jgi:hypothetical protein
VELLSSLRALERAFDGDIVRGVEEAFLIGLQP